MEFEKRGQGFVEKYCLAAKFGGIKIPGKILLLITFIVFVATLAASLLFFDFTVGFLAGLLVLDIGLGAPFFLEDRKVEALERRLPDVLHHIAITLKTSGTIESALREVSKIDYGPITDGIKIMTREISEGKTFEDAFRDYAFRSRSSFLQKCAVIIIAARKSGGSLFETLTATAEDIRALSNLRRERRAKTFMQYSFIMVAGCVIAPFVFGILKSVLEILFSVGAGVGEGTALVGFFDLLFKSYLIIESALGTLGAVQVREGRWRKGIIYIPIAVIVTYIIYLVVSATFMGLLTRGIY